eukprot:Clim_evm1s249 gene=Clim_evmTU1s249
MILNFFFALCNIIALLATGISADSIDSASDINAESSDSDPSIGAEFSDSAAIADPTTVDAVVDFANCVASSSDEPPVLSDEEIVFLDVDVEDGISTYNDDAFFDDEDDKLFPACYLFTLRKTLCVQAPVFMRGCPMDIVGQLRIVGGRYGPIFVPLQTEEHCHGLWTGQFCSPTWLYNPRERPSPTTITIDMQSRYQRQSQYNPVEPTTAQRLKIPKMRFGEVRLGRVSASNSLGFCVVTYSVRKVLCRDFIEDV